MLNNFQFLRKSRSRSRPVFWWCGDRYRTLSTGNFSNFHFGYPVVFIYIYIGVYIYYILVDIYIQHNYLFYYSRGEHGYMFRQLSRHFQAVEVHTVQLPLQFHCFLLD